MRDEKLKKLLSKLADFTAEPVPDGLDEDIRHHIPYRLVRHKVNWHTFRIMIDLRLSRSVAAAVIIVSISVWATFLGAWSTSPNQILQDSKLLMKCGWDGEKAGRGEVLQSLEDFCAYLAEQGEKVTYYGRDTDPDNDYAILMHWKLSDGQHRVIFNDLSTMVVPPDTLIKLQTYMLKKHLEE